MIEVHKHIKQYVYFSISIHPNNRLEDRQRIHKRVVGRECALLHHRPREEAMVVHDQ